MRLLLVAAAAIVRREGGVPQVLLAQRPAGKPLAGLWEFPGGQSRTAVFFCIAVFTALLSLWCAGKLEVGEPPESCLVRELKEELDIIVDDTHLTPITFASHALDAEKHLLMPLWRVTEFEGEPIGAEGQQLAWVEADALPSYEMPPADLPLIEPVQRAMQTV